MINAHLVPGCLSGYTLDVSKTTLPRQGHGIDTGSVKEHVSKGVMLAALLAGPAHAWVTTQAILLHHLT